MIKIQSFRREVYKRTKTEKLFLDILLTYPWLTP